MSRSQKMTPPSAPCAAATRRLSFHRCPRDFGELAEKQLFAVIPEGQGLDEEFLYLGAVHEQEEGDVEDESQVGQESQRVLA